MGLACSMIKCLSPAHRLRLRLWDSSHSIWMLLRGDWMLLFHLSPNRKEGRPHNRAVVQERPIISHLEFSHPTHGEHHQFMRVTSLGVWIREWKVGIWFYFFFCSPTQIKKLFSLFVGAYCKDCPVWQKSVCGDLLLRLLNMVKSCVWMDQEELNKASVKYSV